MKKRNFFLILFLSFITAIPFHPVEINDEEYSHALSCENQGKIKEAVKHYEEYIKKINDRETIEKIILKIARIIPDYDESVKYYKYFFTKNPDSKYKFIARYELAILHKLNGNNGEALKEFMTLAKESKDNKFYSEKANINISEIEIENLQYDEAASQLSRLMDNTEDYDDNGKIYYLMGLTKFKQGIFTDAERYLRTAALIYPLSSKAAASLFELVLIYKNSGRSIDEKRTAEMILNLYPDSVEADRLKEIINNKNLDINKKNSGIDPSGIIKDAKAAGDFQDHLKIDLNDSILPDDEKKDGLESAYYIQLGYYSAKENADLIAESCRKKWIKDIFVAKTRSNDSNKIFYRVVAGPYCGKEDANQKNLELKDKKIEAIILELYKFYE